MKKLIFTSLLALFFGFNCSAQTKGGKSKVCITELEYEVYGAVGVANFQNETVAQPLSPDMEAAFEGVSPDTAADYRRKNAGPHLLRCVNKANGKTARLKKSSGGNLDQHFSRIGLGRDGKEAFFYNTWAAAGNNCGAEFVLLRKNGARWEVVKKVTTYVC